MKKRQRTLTRLMLIMTSLVVVSLLITSFFVREYIKKREDEIIRQKIYSTAKLISNDKGVIDELKQRKISKQMQEFTNRVMEETGTDFIVITDDTFTRYTHPNDEFIGEKFSSIEDASSTFTIGDLHSNKRWIWK